jgi:hypothetical protein
MWILLFLLTALKFSHGKPYDKDVFRNELNELVVHWESPIGEFFLLKQHQKKIFKLTDNKFEPIQIIELIGNVSIATAIDYPTDITGDSCGNIRVLDCSGQVTKLTPRQQNYVLEVDGAQDELLVQFDDSSTSLCLRPLNSYMHRNIISVSSFVATQGKAFFGVPSSEMGRSVSIGGDVNGDGKADMLIGAPQYSTSTGQAYLFYGSSSLTNIGSLGITITGESTNSYTGGSVSIGGDVNGDGKADMLIGARQYSSYTGRVYLIYGSSSLTNIALGSLTPTQGITITGESTMSFTGHSVSIGGDVNGDGKADMLIGAYQYYQTSATGRVYLIYGSSSLTNIALGSLTPTQGITISGEAISSSTGISVSIGGDVNGDGKPDILVGASSYGTNTGRIYLIYGSSSLTNIALGSLTPTQGITITGEATSSYTGSSVCIGGDVNGDGKADMLIGAAAYASSTGRVYLIYGNSSLSNIALGSLTSTQGITITAESTNSAMGHSVSIGGDLNGDGKADMLIGAPQYSTASGRVYLIYGSSSLTNIALGSLTPTQGITITGESDSFTGFSVSIGGDVNGDGKADMLIGATAYSSYTGRSYLMYGNPLANILLGSDYPTSQPTMQPTLQPTKQPVGNPTSQPSSQPSGQPSSRPTFTFTRSFTFTGSIQTFMVPSYVTRISVDITGAAAGGVAGGNKKPGYGARVQATIPITGGTVLNIFVGGKGGAESSDPVSGGWNGGGATTFAGTGGGGASDIRVGGTALSNRIIVAGGGGGINSVDSKQQIGGDGGTVGETGIGGSTAGSGGSATSGGTGICSGPAGLGFGGSGTGNCGGGGGGFYGGKSFSIF